MNNLPQQVYGNAYTSATPGFEATCIAADYALVRRGDSMKALTKFLVVASRLSDFTEISPVETEFSGEILVSSALADGRLLKLCCF